MKVALVSTQFAINFGAVLQAIALKKVITNIGHECEIINYRPINSLKNFAYSSILFLNYKFRSDKKSKILRFDKFVKEHGNLSPKKYSSYDELITQLPYYDCFVCGSDQIWNLNLFRNLSFFLKFENLHPKSNYVAYAPSITEKLNPEQFKELAKNISHFSSISLREKIGAVQLSEYLGYTVKNVLDPVFLLSKEEWIALEEPLPLKEPYILNYGLVGAKNTAKLLKKAKDKYNLKIVNINIDPFNKYNADYNITNLSPGNFIWLIRNADFICSSSFHGMVFSIVFEKQFLASPADYRNSRHANVLEIINSEERLVGADDDLDVKLNLAPLDYQKVNALLNEAKVESVEYLRNAINGKK